MARQLTKKMDEEIDSRFHYSIQNPENRDFNRSSYRNYGKTAFCRPVLMVTMWDVVCQLWTNYIMEMNNFEEMELQDQKKYLSRMLIILADKIIMMVTNVNDRPTAVNVTISAEKMKIVKFMFGASVRSGAGKKSYENNELIAMSRVKTMPILQWCHSNVAKPRENPIVATVLGATAQNRCLGGQCMDERKTENTVSSCGPERSICQNNDSRNHVTCAEGRKAG
ncbi:11925_t:CDS:2 [Funneliformis mosseae]|uniref:11925_t:CDS:1 n=1 Tax=Funneliformis mosseae TaxID=27381 RepID=A0A9N9HK98_FUNMO|nr:11925_t:CDS:2 [Funneliformis mosseae]